MTAEDRVAAALRYLDAAEAQDFPGTARTALVNIGLAEAELGSRSLVDDPASAAALRSRAAPLGKLIARAAINISSMDLEDALLARSGYQDLLDLGTWSEPPLNDFHLGELDEELADAVAAAPGFPVPAGIPDTHRWWRP